MSQMEPKFAVGDWVVLKAPPGVDPNDGRVPHIIVERHAETEGEQTA